MRRTLSIALFALGALACGAPSALRVQVVTDLSPGRDFDSMVVALGAPALDERTVPAELARSWSRATSLSTFEGLAEGTYHVSVAVRLSGNTRMTVARTVRVSGLSVVTIRVTADCAGVACADGETCLAGTCMSDRCTPETPASCPNTCDPASCATAIACVSTECTAEGVCFAEAHDALCAAGEVCDAGRGCVPACTATGCAPTRCAWDPIPALSTPRRIDELTTSEDEYDAFTGRDGAELYFARTDASSDTSDIFVAPRLASGSFGGAVLVPPPLSSPLNDGAVHLHQRGGVSEWWVSSSRAGGGTRSDLFRIVGGVETRIAELSTDAQEEDPRVTTDGRSIFFTRIDGVADILTADRATADAPFGATRAALPGHALGDVFDPSLTEDDLTMVFAANPPGTPGGLDLFVARRPAIDAPFGTPLPISAVNTDGDEAQAFLRANGCELYFTLDGDLYVSTATPDF